MIRNRLQPKFTAKSVANEMLCWKPMYWPALTGWASILISTIFSHMLLKIIFYCIADQPFSTVAVLDVEVQILSWVSPTFQTRNSGVNMQLYEHWAQKKIPLTSESYGKYLSPDLFKMWWYDWKKICTQEFWYILWFLSGFDIQLEQPKNENLVCKNWFKTSSLQDRTIHTCTNNR